MYLRNRARIRWISSLVGSMTLTTAAVFAQSSDRPFFRLFQNKNTPTPQQATNPAQAPATSGPLIQEDINRIVAIQVELGWLADPYTFPFHLTASVDQGRLVIRGNVPTRAVHERVVRVAQSVTSLPIVDNCKENPGINVKQTRVAQNQLQSGASSALSSALGRNARNLQVRASADGKVALVGTVGTFEEKLKASAALRPVRGCTSVNNVIQVSTDPDGHLARALARPQTSTPVTPTAPTPATLASKTPNTPAVPRLTSNTGKGPELSAPVVIDTAPGSKTTPDATPTIVLPPDPMTTKTDAPIVVREQPVNKNVPKLNAVQLKKRIEQACPAARNVQIEFKTAENVRVEVQAARPEDSDTLAGQLLSLPELDVYKVDLHINIPQGTQKTPTTP